MNATKLKKLLFGIFILAATQTVFSNDMKSNVINLSAIGYDKHIYLKWSVENKSNDTKEYNVFRSEFKNKNFVKINSQPVTLHIYSDWIGERGKTYYYRIEAISGNDIFKSIISSASARQLSDDEFMDSVQYASFQYFYEGAHPESGMARERYPWDNACASGGTGMGITAIVIGVERGYIDRKEGSRHILKILRFMSNKAERYHGAWPHWMDGETGQTLNFAGNQYDNGGDIVETSFLLAGALIARQYFNADSRDENEIRSIVDILWKQKGTCVDWKWYLHNNNTLTWHWSKEYGWKINHPVQGFDETMITYLLSIACPNVNYNIPVVSYKDGWAQGGKGKFLSDKEFYGYNQYVSCFNTAANMGMPLFWLHYSFMWFDPRGVNDGIIPTNVTFFDICRNICLIDKAYCSSKPYNKDDSKIWGLTAGYEPDKSYGRQFSQWGYGFHRPSDDNGTINPTAAVSSIVYTPEQSIATMRYFYDNYGGKLWGEFGFKDAFNSEVNWFSNGYLAIDQAPMVIMIENYRSQLIWKLFMSHPDIIKLMTKLKKSRWRFSE